MIDMAARTKRVVQVGTQQRSGKHYQRAREAIRDGQIGQVMSVRMQAYRNVMPGFGSPADCDPPAELDWNMFLGPAPQRPYNPNRGIYHFRWFWDYSGGQMTNLGQHSLDIMHWTLGGILKSVSSTGGRYCLQDNGETPDTQDAILDFANETPPIASLKKSWTALWSHREASAGAGNTSSIEFYGTKGMLAISRRGFTITADKRIPPENQVPQFAGQPVGGVRKSATKSPDATWTKSVEDRSGSESEQFTLHVRNFLDCVKSRQQPISDLACAHRISTMCHLANLSLRLGRQIPWDASRQDAVADAEVTGHLVRAYRAPWDAELAGLMR
jgi:predicted dehydrogenase